MDIPQIIINAKVYPQVEGSGALDLARACSQAAVDAGTVIGLAPPQLEVGRVAQEGLPALALYAQHTDALEPGSGTGWITAEAVQAAGAVGSIVNHAEHKIDHPVVGDVVNRLRHLDLHSLVCADGDAEVAALAPLNPTFIAVEPPALIGGDISVTSADPAIVSDTVASVSDLAPGTLTLCGAGVKTGKDVATALELGAYGVLLASGVVKATDPAAALADLCSGL